MNDKPHRRYQLNIALGADTYEDMLRSVHQFADYMEMYHPTLESNHNGAAGSPDAGYHYNIKYDPEMTHERFFEAIEAWKREQRPPSEETPFGE